MILERLSPEEKSKYLDEILSNFYNRNFGRMSKTDFETLIFRILLEYKRKYEPDQCTDYALSNILGISQSRVRNLKQRTELIYPRKNFSEKWKKIFANDVKHAQYDEHTGLVKMNIPDIAVLIELRNFMEKNSWYDEYQLNPKLFQCPLPIFLSLCHKIDGQEIDVDKIAIENLERLQLEVKGTDAESVIDLLKQGKTKEALKQFGGKISQSILCDILDTVPFGNTIKVFYEALMSR